MKFGVMLSKNIFHYVLNIEAYGGSLLKLTNCSNHGRCLRDSSTATVSATDKFHEDFNSAKPFSQIPGPKALPFVGNILELPQMMFSSSSHLHMVEKFKEYGPILKMKIGSVEIVHLCDVDAVEKVHRLEGKYPRRLMIELWKSWRDRHGLDCGILIREGPEWKRMRSTLDKRMLRPAHVSTYADNFNGVVTDFVQRLRDVRDKKSDGLHVPGVDHELFHWSLETIGTVLYEVRLGGLADIRDKKTDKFIQAVQDVFIATKKIFFFPDKISRVILPKWRNRHENAWQTIFDTSEFLVAEKLKRLQASGQTASSSESASFLEYLLSSNLSRGEIYANISELMLGAVDTTSNTMQWVLYEVARHKDIQQELHKEVTTIVPRGKIPAYDDLQKMPMLKAIVKETLRLYPIAGVSTRVLNQDLVLCGYQVPVNTAVITDTYSLGRDSKLYVDAEKFMPERWLRSGDAEHVHTFAWLPFGFGPRMCIGRRVAELEMHLLLARIAQTFELQPDPQPLHLVTSGLRVPERSVNVGFVDRK